MILSCAEWTSSHSRDALVRAGSARAAHSTLVASTALHSNCSRNASATGGRTRTTLGAAPQAPHPKRPTDAHCSHQADRMEAEGRNDVAAILRLKRSASLRKESMLTLAREWRYKADMWQRGSSGVPGVPRRRVAPAAAGGAPRIGAPRSGVRRIEGDGGAYQRRTQADHNAAAQAAHSAQALQAHLAALAAPNAWLNALRGLQMMAPQQAEPSANASAAAVQALRGAISTSARRIATDTAAVWEGVAARAAAATLHAGGAAPVTPTAADALNDNAQSLSVARWLRSVAGAHASALDDEWRASGSPQAGPALTALLRQMSDYSSQLDAQLALVRAELAAPSAGGADARSSWAGQLQRTLDDALTWLAHAKSSAAAMTGAPPGGAAHAGATVARITADFFGAAEEALLLRRQWLVLSPSPGAPAALGAHDGAAAAAAVMAAVMATAGVMPPQQVSQVAAYPQPPPVPEPMVQPPSSAAAVPMAA